MAIAAAPDEIVVATGAGSVVALDLATGVFTWSRLFSTAVTLRAAVQATRLAAVVRNATAD
ncbi:MAG: hypothetical protein M3P23_16145 [Actinomycetota bacterium]|nr:hypothetical protein [Actinomycetota bacterium]